MGQVVRAVILLVGVFFSSAYAGTSVDKEFYIQKMLEIANYPAPIGGKTLESPPLWPVTAVIPNEGALLPFNRIVAYYGNFYSKRMGVLGEYPPEQVISMLNEEVRKWQTADPNTPVIRGIDYIAVVAQKEAGRDGLYRKRMPDSEIQKALYMARQVSGIAILDIQIGLSNVQTEIPYLEQYLIQPDVHLALDPEFSMKNRGKPGEVIGTMDAADINFAAYYLAELVRKNNLPPKVLIIHRFTQRMITNYKEIKPLPEVQIVIDMDGWGSQAKKLSTYKSFIYREPVQFSGFKLFYKNDLKPPSTGLFTPGQMLKFTPQPMFILYQ